MKYEFSFYKDFDFEALEELVLKSYEWEYPAVGISRVEFAKGLHPHFCDCTKAWEHTVGMYWENKKLVACVWNEGTYDGDVFFLFDNQQRATETDLINDMINFSKMFCVTFEGEATRSFQIFIPSWNTTLLNIALGNGFTKSEWADHIYIRSFDKINEELPVQEILPNGYSIIDGNTSPAFYLSNVHRMAFGYGKDSYSCEHGAEAFADLRKMPHYDKDLDLCILDDKGRPVAIAIIWYDEKMPYCELEPLGVIWLERRKGLGTAILNEATNRIIKKYPNCKGIKGGDQQFYNSIGFEQKAEIFPYQWKKEIFISWDNRSKDLDYKSEKL